MPDSSSLAKIAAMVGVSSMTVSRVLRNSPSVAPATRERVLAAARSLNYVPDPHLARMMHLVRNRKPVHQHGVIAVVRDYVPDDALLSPSYKYVPLEDMRRRAKNYGYDVEEFQLGRDRLTPKRLQEILHARGTEGVIVSPQSIALPCSQLDYGPFASVSIGFAMRDHVASAAIDIVVAQLYNNERGLPSVPRQILLPTQWVDGPSIRKAPAAQSAPETAGKGKVARRRAKAEVAKRG